MTIVTNQPEANAANEQRLVKSAERVRDLGEVFTPSHIVNDMLSLLPDEMWRPHPPATFLEPACGDGNFLIAILDRKLQHVTSHTDDPQTRQILALAALASIYGVDISPENILGGHPEHPIGARDRLLNHLIRWHRRTIGTAVNPRSRFYRTATWIVTHNIHLGDMLHNQGRDIPIVDYNWQVDEGCVSVTWLTVGLIQTHANAGSDPNVLFDEADTTPLPGPAHTTDWDGLHLLTQHPGRQIDLRDGNVT